jgi:peptidoglycan-associated lipoprotein
VGALAALLAACSSTPPPPVEPPKAVVAPPPAPVAPPPPPAAATVAVPPESPMQMFERERARLADRSVFFGYDQFSITPDQVSSIEDHARLAQKFTSDQVTLQGNCDERGGREYNLALGEKRANAVKSRLVLLGVPGTRISTVSFGKEKPRAQCHDESCWSQNRRADFVDSWQ